MPHLPADAPPQFGMGALDSPRDPRDYLLPAAAARAAAGTASGLTAFRLGNRPPITNQGDTPHCVSYATGNEQNWQDRVDTGRFYDFNQPLYHARIGGTAAGAFARAALDELIGRGYPEQDATPAEHRHRARVYTRVVQSVQAVKDAIVTTGGVLGVGPWFPNWTTGLGSLGVLPAPSGLGTGHEVWYTGWDEHGVIGDNSWGTLWADRGSFRMAWPIFIGQMSEVWTTLDERTTELMYNKARIRYLDVTIRPERILDDQQLRPASRWAQTRQAGIRRLADNKLIVTPWDRLFRFGGFREGPRHGIGRHPTQWGRLRIAGAWRVVPRAAVQVHWAT